MIDAQQTPGACTEALLKEPARAVAAAIRRREVSATEVVQAHLARIADVNPHLNAIVTIAGDEARSAAKEADRALSKRESVGPLHGLPFTVKDVIATKGVRTTAGSRILADYVPSTSAPAVERVQRAGGILLGKSNCPEFALDINTDNDLFGRTRNPWNSERTSGGSSGGESAAVAGCCSAFGIGTDYGGSIRWPAHCTGLAALRPTGGIVPGTGQLPYTPLPGAGLQALDRLPPPNSMSLQSQLQRIAPIARSADDLWPLLLAMAGPDGADSQAAPVTLGDPDDVDVRGLGGVWSPSDGSAPVAPDVARVVEDAAAALAEMGMRMRCELPPGLERAERLFDAFRRAEGVPDHEALIAGHEDEITESVRQLVVSASATDVREYRALAAQRDMLRAEIVAYLEQQPILLLPVASISAFVPDPQTFLVEGEELPRFKVLSCARAISLLNLPVAVVPCGTASDGLPVGVQVVARPYRDHEAVAVAKALERAFGRWRPPGDASVGAAR